MFRNSCSSLFQEMHFGVMNRNKYKERDKTIFWNFVSSCYYLACKNIYRWPTVLFLWLFSYNMPDTKFNLGFLLVSIFSGTAPFSQLNQKPIVILNASLPFFLNMYVLECSVSFRNHREDLEFLPKVASYLKKLTTLM